MISKKKINEKVWEQAYDNVVRIRGSWDVPGFDYCVKTEYEILMEELENK